MVTASVYLLKNMHNWVLIFRHQSTTSQWWRCLHFNTELCQIACVGPFCWIAEFDDGRNFLLFHNRNDSTERADFCVGIMATRHLSMPWLNKKKDWIGLFYERGIELANEKPHTRETEIRLPSQIVQGFKAHQNTNKFFNLPYLCNYHLLCNHFCNRMVKRWLLSMLWKDVIYRCWFLLKETKLM